MAEIEIKPILEIDNNSYLKDSLCSALIDIFNQDRLRPKKVRTIKVMINQADSYLGPEAHFFSEGDNLKEIFNFLNNNIACKAFLLIDEGYSLSGIAKEVFIQDRKKRKHLSSHISYWTEKLSEMGLIKKSDLGYGRQTVYEYEYDRFPKVTTFIKLLCQAKLGKGLKDVINPSHQ